MKDVREGEVAFDRDPAAGPHPAGLVFIGRVRSPWIERADCPKNMRAAREQARPARIEIDAPWRAALAGLEAPSPLWLITFFDRARRDLAVQRPRHAQTPHGTFSLRSPVRPNPIGLHLVELTAIDAAAGILDIAAVDVLDGTPVLDLKPYFATVDVPPAP